MTRARSVRVLLSLTVALGALALPLAASDARPKTPPVVVAPPPAPPAPPAAPPIGLPDRLINDAAAYEAYVASAAAISPAFSDGASVARALRVGAAYEPKGLVRGVVALGAIAALQDRAFVAEVRSVGATAAGRRAIVAGVYANPAYALSFHSSRGAAGNARFVMGDSAMRVFRSGKAVKQSAYDVQHSAWSKEPVADREGRLNAIKALGVTPVSGAPDRMPVLRSAVLGQTTLGFTAPPAAPPYTPLVARAVALAALAAIGEAGDANYDNLASIASEVDTAFCLSMAKLNLNQCLAVAKPHYEDIFCLGQHVLIDTGACIAKYAGAALPLEIYSRPLKIPPARPAARPRPRRK